MKRPDYKKIYYDLLAAKFPEKLTHFKPLLEKQRELSVLEVVVLNEAVLKGKEDHRENQKYKSYDRSAILEILGYQKKNQLNNTQLALHFKLSRNTVAFWKKKFIV